MDWLLFWTCSYEKITLLRSKGTWLAYSRSACHRLIYNRRCAFATTSQPFYYSFSRSFGYAPERNCQDDLRNWEISICQIERDFQRPGAPYLKNIYAVILLKPRSLQA